MLLSPTPIGVVSFLPFHASSASTPFLTFTPPPTPPPSCLKRAHPDSATTTYSPPSKKRRILLVRPTSRLAAPAVEPAEGSSALRFPPPHPTYSPGFPRKPSSSLKHVSTCTVLAPVSPGCHLIPTKFSLRKAAILNLLRTVHIAASKVRERQRQVVLAQRGVVGEGNVGVEGGRQQQPQFEERRSGRGRNNEEMEARGADKENIIKETKPSKPRRRQAAKKEKKSSRSNKSRAALQDNCSDITIPSEPTPKPVSTPKQQKPKPSRRRTPTSPTSPDMADPHLIVIPITPKRRRRTKAEMAEAAVFAAANLAKVTGTAGDIKTKEEGGAEPGTGPPVVLAPAGGRKRKVVTVIEKEALLAKKKQENDPFVLAVPVHRRPPSPPSEAELEEERRKIGVA